MGLLNEIASCRNLGYRRLADGARLYRMEKTGFSTAQSLRPLGTSQRAAYFLLALYYIAQDQLRSITSSFMPHTFLQVCLDGAGWLEGKAETRNFIRPLYILNMGAGAAALLSPGDAADILIDRIMRSSEHTYTFKELMQTFQSQFASYGKIDKTTLKNALNLLVKKKEIFEINDGFKIYNQPGAITAVQNYLLGVLSKTANLQKLFSLAGQAIRELFDNVDLYLIAEMPDADTEMRIVFGDENSSHMNWRAEKSGGVFQRLLEESDRGKPNSLFIERVINSEHVSNNGPIFPEAVAAYQERFEQPDAVLFAAAPVFRGADDSRRRIGAIGLKVHGWTRKGDGGENSVIYKGGERATDTDRSEVDQAIEGLVLTIANQVARLAAKQPRKTLKELMAIVAASSRSLESQQRSTAIVPVETDCYAFGRSVKLRRRDAHGNAVRMGLSIINDPSKFFSGDPSTTRKILEDMLDAFFAAWKPVMQGGAQLDRASFMGFIKRRYWDNAVRFVAMQDLDNPSRLGGFATLVREIVNAEGIIRLAGTVVTPAFQGMRLSVKLNRFLLYALWREGGKHPMTVCTYTGSPLVFGSLMGLEGVYPDPHQPDKEPSPAQVEIFKELARRHFPDAEIDEKYFIVRGGLKTLGLAYDSERIQLHRDPAVNRFFAEHVDSGNGDLVFPIGLLTQKVLRRETRKDFLFTLYKTWNRIVDALMRRTLI